MKSIILGLLALATVALAFKIRIRCRSIGKAFDRCDREWSQLRECLLKRHLIVSHLLESLPENLVGPGLAASNIRAKASLVRLQPKTASGIEYGDVVKHQREFLWQLDELLEQVQHLPSVEQSKPVAACLDGLAQADGKIREATSSYNTSVINCHARQTSLGGRWLCKLMNQHSVFIEVEFRNSGSDYERRWVTKEG